MLVLKSFDMSDEKGMNELLTQTVLAEKSSVFVSNGRIVLQVDDGQPMNNKQKIVEAMENRNKKVLAIEIIEHDLQVLEAKVQNVETQIQKLESDTFIPTTKADYDKQKTNTEALKHLKAVLDTFTKQRVNYQAAIDETTVEMDIYTDRISDLEDFPEPII